MSQADDLFAGRGVERLVVGSRRQAGAVTGEHHDAVQTAEAEAHHAPISGRPRHQLGQARLLRAGEAIVERVAGQQRLDGDVSDQLCLRPAFGPAALLGVGSIGGGQGGTEKRPAAPG